MFVGAICDSGSVGRVQPCQGWGRGFEPRLSLLIKRFSICFGDLLFFCTATIQGEENCMELQIYHCAAEQLFLARFRRGEFFFKLGNRHPVKIAVHFRNHIRLFHRSTPVDHLSDRRLGRCFFVFLDLLKQSLNSLGRLEQVADSFVAVERVNDERDVFSEIDLRIPFP